jgi:ferritin-like metal-binding protein YciE
MAEVEDARALLVMALRDLHDGEAALTERLPEVHGNARDSGLRQVLEADRARSADQQTRLEPIASALGEQAGGATNIWLRAILDDADNDARTIAEGPLRDIALTGALRKAQQSERVSYETALALAERLDMAEAAATLRAIRDEEQAADEALARVLSRLCGEESLDTSPPMLGWKLDRAERAALLARFPPRYARADADHVTHGRKGKAPPLPEARRAVIVGRADDGAGVEAMVVEIAGTTERWDGSRYHITWSLAEGRKAVESNTVIAEQGWEDLAERVAVGLTAQEWP